MPYYFFPATKTAARQETELFDFIWPTTAALWNLRWQVAGFLKEAPLSTPKQLNDRFVFGSGIHGTNLSRACVETTWDAQKHHLAGIVLTNAFSIYEHWADEILSSLGLGPDKGKVLQFDDGPKGEPGLPATVRNACAKESVTLKAAYYPVFAKSPKYSWPIMSNLLACYRYFKELRNSQIHNGGKATSKAEQAYKAFAPVSKKEALGMKGELRHHAAVQGQPVLLDLRGVVGFCDVLLRIMVTVDAELCRSERAESILESAFSNGKARSTLSGNPRRRHMQVLGRCKAAGLPAPSDAKAIEKFLVRQRLIMG